MVFYLNIDGGCSNYAGPVHGFTECPVDFIRPVYYQVIVADGAWCTEYRDLRRIVCGRDTWPVAWYGKGDSMIVVVCPD